MLTISGVKKGKGSPYSITERRVPELIPVLGSLGFKSQSRLCNAEWYVCVGQLVFCNSLRQTVHTHCASVHQAAKLVAALLRVAGVTAGLAESNGSLPSGL